MKRINCKHDLESKQELMARRIRRKLEEGDNETLEKYHNIYVAWYNSKTPHFIDFLKSQDIIYYSAYVRIKDKMKIKEVNQKIMFFGAPEYYGYPIH